MDFGWPVCYLLGGGNLCGVEIGMTDRFTARLLNPVQAHQCIKAAYEHAKGHLVAGGAPLVLTVKVDSRREGTSRWFHSLINQISAQLGGDLADAEDCKRILISAFRIDTRTDPGLAGEWAKFGDVRMGRGLRSEVVLLGIQSRDFSNRLGLAFVTWLEAFGAESGVKFKAWESDQ